MSAPHSKSPQVQPVMQPAIAEVDRHLVEAKRLITAAAVACLRHAGNSAEAVQSALHAVEEARAAMRSMQEDNDAT